VRGRRFAGLRRLVDIRGDDRAGDAGRLEQGLASG
jgi:hypothetical protein